MSHALVIGGTGMLRGVCVHLADRFDVVSVIARDASRLQSVAADAEAAAGVINPIALDYCDSDRLHAAVDAAAQEFGQFQLAVCWIHDTAPGALATIAPILARSPDRCSVVLIVGSSHEDPTVATSSQAQLTAHWPALRVQRVTLGFVIDGGQSRWLTDREICDGVIAAIDNGTENSVVGETRPWSSRPGD